LGRDRSDEVDIYDKQHDIGGVDLPDPLEDAGHRNEQASFYRHLAVKHRRGVTGREEKEIRGATEPEIPRREQAHHVIRNMVEKDRPVGDPEHNVEPEIATIGSEISFRRWGHSKVTLDQKQRKRIGR